jgi:hypothetical protein
MRRKERSKSICSIVSRKHDVYHSCCERLDVTDYTWATTVKHEDDRTSCSCKSLDKLLLVGRKIEILIVTRSLAVCILTYTCYDHIGLACRSDSLLDACSLVELPVCSHQVVLYARDICDIVKLLVKSLVDCIVLVGKLWS